METCSTSTEEAGGLWGPQQGADSETQSSVKTQNTTTTSATVNNWLINNIKADETKTAEDRDAQEMCITQLSFNEVLISSSISQPPANDIIAGQNNKVPLQWD